MDATPARTVTVGPVTIANDRPLVLIAGPCQAEGVQHSLDIAGTLAELCAARGIGFIFKASYDKANRTALEGRRGLGLEKGLACLAAVRREIGCPVLTDVHEPGHCAPVAEVVDVLQIPAFLCRQTDLLVAAGRAASKTSGGVNVKKGQFLSPGEMVGPVRKLHESGCDNVMLTERGTFFGYHRLVSDFVGVGQMMRLDVPGGPPPVCFDCTHSTQTPGSGAVTGGNRDMAPLLARAAVAIGVHAIFLECHPDPDRALSDAATQIPLAQTPGLLADLARLHQAVHRA